MVFSFYLEFVLFALLNKTVLGRNVFLWGDEGGYWGACGERADDGLFTNLTVLNTLQLKDP